MSQKNKNPRFNRNLHLRYVERITKAFAAHEANDALVRSYQAEVERVATLPALHAAHEDAYAAYRAAIEQRHQSVDELRK